MYFQFLVEDRSTEILIRHVVKKLEQAYPDKQIYYDTKSFKGIGHLPKKGTALERKTGQLLNDLPFYLRGFDKKLRHMRQAALVIVVDNDMRDTMEFNRQLEELAVRNMVLMDHVFCIAVKEMEAWLLGDIFAIEQAYPDARKSYLKEYEQDGICDTWEVLANVVYPGGLIKLKKKAANSYMEIGRAKAEWADKIGQGLRLDENSSPSFRSFVNELEKRILAGTCCKRNK